MSTAWDDDDRLLDSILDSASTSSNAWDFDSDFDEPTANPHSDLSLDAARIHRALLNYTQTTSLPSFPSRLSRRLLRLSAHDLVEYYVSRPGLKEYTLGVEMDRMGYELITKHGQIREKEDIRGYFTNNKGEELLIRSANQSLLADALALLTCREDILFENDHSNDNNITNNYDEDLGWIASGPLLSMSCKAESCHFHIDLINYCVRASCVLAASVPFVGDSQSNNSEDRLVLSRLGLSVHFHPGTDREDPRIQCNIEWIDSSFVHSEDPRLKQTSISLARDAQPMEEPHDISQPTDDPRDLFLINHQLISESFLRGAEANITGFKSALRQLDGVTNVSAKLKSIKANGFLTLPSAKEIEAAELPEEMAHGKEAPRPRPLIGGLFMEGLSRLKLKAVAQPEARWGAGTGLTPPPSPGREQDKKVPLRDGRLESAGLARLPVGELGRASMDQISLNPSANRSIFCSGGHSAHIINPVRKVDGFEGASGEVPPPDDKFEDDIKDVEEDDGWSDDNLDFEDEVEDDDSFSIQGPKKQTYPPETNFKSSTSNPSNEGSKVNDTDAPVTMNRGIPPPNQPKLASHQLPAKSLTQIPYLHQPNTSLLSFEEEFEIILKEKIEREEKKMIETGRMRRWRPISEDPNLRSRLMEVMVNQLDNRP